MDYSQQLIDKTAEYIKQKLTGEGSGHDWWHVYRVWQIAMHIANEEMQADKMIVEMGALLHDIADWKFAGGDLEAGPKAAREWLADNKVEESVITHVENIIRDTSFKGAEVNLDLKTLEAKIVFDADKLDAIGAIGIGRTFAYGGSKGHPMYEPSTKPVMHKTFEEYKNSGSPTVNHFYEKLLLLRDLMHTEIAKKMAHHRHEFMKQFLDEFYKEWEGEL